MHVLVERNGHPVAVQAHGTGLVQALAHPPTHTHAHAGTHTPTGTPANTHTTSTTLPAAQVNNKNIHEGVKRNGHLFAVGALETGLVQALEQVHHNAVGLYVLLLFVFYGRVPFVCVWA